MPGPVKLTPRAAPANHHLARKIRVFEHYFGPAPKCASCPESDIKVLCLHHSRGGGSQHRRDLFGCPYQGGSRFYSWLERHKYPRIKLAAKCMNCHTRERYSV